MSEIVAYFGSVFKIETFYCLHDGEKEGVKGDLRSDFSSWLVPCRREHQLAIAFNEVKESRMIS